MNDSKHGNDSGMALLIALIVLLLISCLGFFLCINASTDVQISNNFEAQIQATYAALAGLNHAKSLIRGLSLDDVLRGPDGVWDSSKSYLSQAKSFDFRNPFSLAEAQALDLLDPSQSLLQLPDDGLINTGFYAGAKGIELIPMFGIPLMTPGANGKGATLISRYFVKVVDNNGQTTEIAGDPGDNPFIDGDGIVIVRSIGVAKTISKTVGSARRQNSVAIFESRLKRLATFDVGPPLIVLASDVAATFTGSFSIDGGLYPGIGAIDVNAMDQLFPEQTLQSAVKSGSIIGGGLQHPSVKNITAAVAGRQDQSQLLNPEYLSDFLYKKASQFADNYFSGDQLWTAGNFPDLGTYDVARPWNAPLQNPKVTIVNGNLNISGGGAGGGILIVTGNFVCSGPFEFSGLILVIGSGNLSIQGAPVAIDGSIFVARIDAATSFGAPNVAINGNHRISSNSAALAMAISLFPPAQISFREITGQDP